MPRADAASGRGRGIVGPARPTGMVFSDQQRLDWLRLIRSESIGPRTFQALINRFGGASAALDALPALSRERLGKTAQICTTDQALREIEAARRVGARFTCLGEPDYPFALAQADDAPPVLSLIGRTDVTLMPAIAIVGSRNASFAGQKMAERLAVELGEAGIAVVSGLARGIDAAAHRAALRTGTVAILAGGLDKPYPPDNFELFNAIATEGAVFAEMPIGWEPRGRDFPRRNRIISGLCYATVVVEAAPKSGSLITARFAHEQGREVFAVPGSPLDPRAEGTNDLIFKGEARLLRKAQDVLDTIAPMLADGLPRQQDLFQDEPRDETWRLWDEWPTLGEPDKAARRPMPEVPAVAGMLQEPAMAYASETLRDLIVTNLSAAPLSLDDIARLVVAPVQSVRGVLFELEMSGEATIDDGGMVRAGDISN